MDGNSFLQPGPLCAWPQTRWRPLPQICLAAALVISVSGCAALDRLGVREHSEAQPAQKPPAVVVPPPSPAAPPRTRRIVREPQPPREPTREPERVASIDPKSLIGLAPAAVERLLGAPSTVSKADPSLVWTYSGQGCSFQIIFYPDLKTASFHALKYDSTGGETSDVCVRNILTVRSNGPG